MLIWITIWVAAVLVKIATLLLQYYSILCQFKRLIHRFFQLLRSKNIIKRHQYYFLVGLDSDRDLLKIVQEVLDEILSDCSLGLITDEGHLIVESAPSVILCWYDLFHLYLWLIEKAYNSRPPWIALYLSPNDILFGEKGQFFFFFLRWRRNVFTITWWGGGWWWWT